MKNTCRASVMFCPELWSSGRRSYSTNRAWTGWLPTASVGWRCRTRVLWSGIGRYSKSSSCTGRSEERRVGKECRSLCDWSSDVCSSDLGVDGLAADRLGRLALSHAGLMERDRAVFEIVKLHGKIGRASCRERV